MNTPRISVTSGTRRIVVAGSWTWPWYEQACADALASLGNEVDRFSWFSTFHRWTDGNPEPKARSPWCRAENRLGFGPYVWRTNRALRRLVRLRKPDILFLHNCRLIWASTIRLLRR